MIFNKISSGFLFPITFSMCLLIACSGNNNTGTIAASNSSANAARFSCFIDGHAASGGAIDQMQFYNIGSINEVDEGRELLFYLNDAKSGDAMTDFTYALRFSIPCKLGPVSFGHEEDGWGIEVDIKRDNAHQATYFSDSFTVNVTKLSPTNATGTFSGKFDIREGAFSADAKKHIEVTDGKFDIPMKK